MRERLSKYVAKYEMFVDGSRANSETLAMDEIQTKLGCCGLEDFSDWHSLRQDIPEGSYPKSCCSRQESNAERMHECRSPLKRGCLQQLTEKELEPSLVRFYLWMFTAGQFIDALVAYLLANHYEEEYRQSFYQPSLRWSRPRARPSYSMQRDPITLSR